MERPRRNPGPQLICHNEPTRTVTTANATETRRNYREGKRKRGFIPERGRRKGVTTVTGGKNNQNGPNADEDKKRHERPADINEVKLSNDPEVHERRLKIARLRWVNKWTIQQIIDATGFPERTIYRDLAKVREANEKARKKGGSFKQDTNSVIAQLELGHAERQRNRWQNYHNTKDEGLRRRILNDIGEEEERFVKMLQSMGIIDKAADQVNVNQTTETWNDKLERLKREREAARITHD